MVGGAKMSRSASIDLLLKVINLSNIDIIKELLDYGWSFNDDGQSFYLPIGDDDEFDWQRVELSTSDLLSILRKKEHLGEVIGVVLTWKKTNIGGEFLFRPDKSISFIISKNRKVLDKTKFTDVAWYMSRIFPAIEGVNAVIESASWEEHV